MQKEVTMPRILIVLAWAWVIALGTGIILTPRGPICTVCGPGFNVAIAVITVVIGALGLVTTLRQPRSAIN
jgi:hypothetical protein